MRKPRHDATSIAAPSGPAYKCLVFTSRLTIDRQTAIPVEVIQALGLQPGDAIAYAIDEDGRVLLGRADDPFINPFALFTEWSSDADREAYADL